MLNTDLLRTTCRNGKIFCRFIDPEKEENLLFARSLLMIYRTGTGRTRTEIASLCRSAGTGAADPKFAAGLEKLLNDRTVFSAADPEKDYPAFRKELFKRSGIAIAQKGDFSEEKYRKSLQLPPLDIYGDLPDFELCTSFKDLTESELLHRYNTALVQTLLLFANSIHLTLRDTAPGELRKIVKFMKFFRLLAQITSPEPNVLELDLSGPGALLENARKYGLLLGAFFPAVLHCKRYTLTADVEIRSRKARLELDEKSRLVSHYHNMAAYVPEEIRLFHRLVKEKSASWQIVGETPFINMGKEGICCPDLSFSNSGKLICHLELFHRWHRGGLQSRLAFLEENPQVPLIIGVDRGAVKDDEFEALGCSFPKAAGRVFRFRDFPGVETVIKMLDKYAENINKESCSPEKAPKKPAPGNKPKKKETLS